MKRLFYDTLVVFILFSTATAYAKTIKLYSEPKTNSTVAGTMNTEAGISIVYTPKSGEWIKVANPANGDVGWIKSSDLGNNSYKMRIFTSDDGTHSYSVYQIGPGHSQFDQKQVDEMRLFEQRQRMMQMHMAHMFNDMFYFPQPVFVPVIMVPERSKLQKTPSAKATS